MPVNYGKSDHAAVTGSSFLFIDSQSDQSISSAASKQKRAFLQREFRRKQKEASIQRLKSSIQPFRAQLPLRYEAATTTPGLDDGVEQTSGLAAVAAADGDYANHTSSKPKQIVRIQSPMSLVSQAFVDPFSSSAVEMTSSMNSYFDHFRIHTIKHCYPLDATRMSMWYWQKAIAQPALLQALLCSTAGHQLILNTVEGVPTLTFQNSTKEFLRLRGDALKTLNGVLRDSMRAVAESTILVIASLVAIEAISATVEAAEAHNKGLKSLVDVFGGIEALDHMTLSKVYQSDVLRAILTNTRPAFPMSPKWRSEILQETKVFQSVDFLLPFYNTTNTNDPDNPLTEIMKILSPLGTSFFKAPWYMSLDPSMKSFLHVMKRLIQYYEIAQLTPSIVMPTDNDLFLLLEYQLVNVTYPVSHNGFNEPLRLALLIYLNMRIWHLHSFPYMAYLTGYLRTALEGVLARLRGDDPRLLFWILFIGDMASLGHEGHSWFVEKLAEIAYEHLGIRGWSEAREVLVGYFYMDQPGDSGGEDLWGEVLLGGRAITLV
ncbi:hypothetical protein BJX68DRAFT_276253 [Aspergillus pseudodeflectus]|uniref:Fungal-specific transcription factor domain-containing protein n=1 Tax=Aspergillus pseudodeflectus TaxID=176178 RepID=A0ABR4K8V5_9EURO